MTHLKIIFLTIRVSVKQDFSTFRDSVFFGAEDFPIDN